MKAGKSNGLNDPLLVQHDCDSLSEALVRWASQEEKQAPGTALRSSGGPPNPKSACELNFPLPRK
jgi:hypothetical protein